MRTLVTGGAGFIGSNLVDRLLVEGHEVDVVDDFSTGSLSNLAEARGSAGRALTIHHLDISAPAVIELMARRRPELVFHLAAQADVRVSVARPAFDATVNVVGSLNVLEGARQAEAERVVFAASGGTLYGEPAVEDLPVRESHPQQPLSPYGVSKKAVIDYLVAYRELHSLEFCALALGNVYGPRQNPHGEAGVVAIFADRVLRGEPVTIFGDGEQTRDYRLRRRRRRRLRARRHSRRWPRLQHRDRSRDVGQRARRVPLASQSGAEVSPCSRRCVRVSSSAFSARRRAGGHPARAGVPGPQLDDGVAGRARVRARPARLTFSGRGPRPEAGSPRRAPRPGAATPAARRARPPRGRLDPCP